MTLKCSRLTAHGRHGVASAESILAVVEKGKKAFLMIVGIVIGWVGKLAGIPTDLLGVSWFGDFFAMLALGVGSIVIGVINDNGFVLSLFGHSASLFSGIFPEGFSSSAMITYMPHGVMIGAGACLPDSVRHHADEKGQEWHRELPLPEENIPAA